MALVKPLVVNSLSVKQWFQSIFLYNPAKFNQGYSPLSENPSEQALTQENFRTILKRHINGTFLETYGFDGYDEVSTEITTAEGQLDENGKHYTYESDALPWGLAVMSFFGIPNRIKYVDDKDKSLFIDAKQVLKNFVGGWNDEAGEEKMFWQQVGSFTIKPIISVLKSCLIFLKTPLNTLKLLTEFLPMLIWRLSEESLYLLDDRLKKNWDTKQINVWKWLLKGLMLSVEILGLAVLGLSLATFRIISIIGRVATSPLKSVRVALGFGQTLNNKWLGWGIGLSALVLSILLTATLWAIAWPIIFSAITTLIPATVPALTALSKLPIVASAIGVIKGGSIMTLGSAIGAAFTLPASAVAALFSLKISASALSVGATFGLLTALPATALNWGADKLSNTWADWVDGGPKSFLLSRFALLGGYTKVEDKELQETPGKKNVDAPKKEPGTTPSPSAVRAATTNQTGLNTAKGAADYEHDESTELTEQDKRKQATPVKPRERSFLDDDELTLK